MAQNRWRPIPEWWVHEPEWFDLSPGACQLLVTMWLRARDGSYPDDPRAISKMTSITTRRCRMAEHLDSLVASGYIERDGGVLTLYDWSTVVGARMRAKSKRKKLSKMDNDGITDGQWRDSGGTVEGQRTDNDGTTVGQPPPTIPRTYADRSTRAISREMSNLSSHKEERESGGVSAPQPHTLTPPAKKNDSTPTPTADPMGPPRVVAAVQRETAEEKSKRLERERRFREMCERKGVVCALDV